MPDTLLYLPPQPHTYTSRAVVDEWDEKERSEEEHSPSVRLIIRVDRRPLIV